MQLQTWERRQAYVNSFFKGSYMGQKRVKPQVMLNLAVRDEGEVTKHANTFLLALGDECMRRLRRGRGEARC